MTEILGLQPPSLLGPFAAVRVGDTSLDYVDAGGEVTSQHYAFLVSEIEFDEIFARIRERGLVYWFDPFHRQRGQINAWDDGRGVYFDDPNGHILEIITRPYGSGGTSASRPHPLVSRTLDSPYREADHTNRDGKHGGGKLAEVEHPRGQEDNAYSLPQPRHSAD